MYLVLFTICGTPWENNKIVDNNNGFLMLNIIPYTYYYNNVDTMT